MTAWRKLANSKNPTLRSIAQFPVTNRIPMELGDAGSVVAMATVFFS